MMKYFYLTFFICLICSICNAQKGDYQVKVVSYKYKTTKGILKKVNAEGIGVEDKKGNYIIYRTEDIERIIVKRNGVRFFEALGSCSLGGLGIGLAVMSIDEGDQTSKELVQAAAAITAVGVATGIVAGTVSEISRKRLTLRVKGDAEFFKNNYQRLAKYVNHSEVYHVGN